ncbi:hypothetical protein WR25_16537 isoform D [Diploscapter pachys]|uniref:Uncharacterized protein n=1 Tax=Diploscapter pachys TaxID=2018661 RepID=A0A2A2JTP8_9BILA|nr:hypothetical protein WR25_16537 isoform C [Diploscapter pachys]PAV65053.1 hypothetical protein WR25_16537 isoform D [Diploscapter pachys]
MISFKKNLRQINGISENYNLQIINFSTKRCGRIAQEKQAREQLKHDRLAYLQTNASRRAADIAERKAAIAEKAGQAEQLECKIAAETVLCDLMTDEEKAVSRMVGTFDNLILTDEEISQERKHLDAPTPEEVARQRKLRRSDVSFYSPVAKR